MILTITSRCTMVCFHCMHSCTPEGIDMSEDTFEQFLKFVHNVNVPILVSGGEPTLHRSWFNMTKTLLDKGYYTLLLSNGLFLDDDQQVDYVKQLQQYKLFGVQLTNDSRYYPLKINFKKAKRLKISVETKIRGVSSEGRAKTNNLSCTREHSACLNPKLVLLQKPMSTFFDIVFLMMSKGKFCFPLIAPTGDIKPGESFNCQKIGTIYDSEEKLVEGLLKTKCNTCVLKNNPYDFVKK